MTRPHVLIVGASGVFGSRLARLLARRQAFRLTLGGRSEARAASLRDELLAIDPQAGLAIQILDRETVTGRDLRRIGCAVVVDCSGPFQLTGNNLIEAAIEAGVHYVDLADSRAFVGAIGRFDAAAKAAGISIISGASSTPGLSHAVLDHLLAGWQMIDSIECAIVPGNKTPKGRSVIEAILSWVGQPVAQFRDGAWQVDRGWSRPTRVEIAGLLGRWAFLADVPDLDAIPARFAPRVRARFAAGMELPVLNWLIYLAGLTVRWGFLKSARAFAGLGTSIANALDPFGTTEGGMLIEAQGLDRVGKPRVSGWQLRASRGDGPYVPVGPAAALVEKLLLGNGVPNGARSAAGLLAIEDVVACYRGLAIDIKESSLPVEPPLYRQVMGGDFDLLPAVTQNLHRGTPAIVAEGDAVVVPARSMIGRLIAYCFGLPTTSGPTPVRVVIEQRGAFEYWTRVFGGKPMRSIMQASAGMIAERFGPLTVQMRLVARDTGLDMERVGGSLFGVPVPGWLLPTIKAEERTNALGHHLFEVDIGLPLLGRLVAYHGHLVL